MAQSEAWLAELVEIARAITQERDIDRLLGLILNKSRQVTGADAGSIYVVEIAGDDDDDPEGRRLRFKLSQNDSVAFESSEFLMEVSSRSIAGAAVMERKAINLPDVYTLPAGASYAFDDRFDARVGYRTVSMLTMPMISAEDEVIGVIQLINRKRDPDQALRTPADFDAQVVPFDAQSEHILGTLASQAGIALENALLYDEIRGIFEGFVRASVQAIEQRDPTTSGHSQRVSVLSCALAEKVDRVDAGPWRSASFSRRDMQELEYAALLHDFGKIGVREEVLVKAKKLYPHERARIRARIELAIRTAQADALSRKLELVRAGSEGAAIAAIDEALREREQLLLQAWDLVERSNEPTVLQEGDFSRIAQIATIECIDFEGQPRPLLTREEVVALSVRRGSLAPEEMAEIQSHVVHTYNFLAKIPWGKSMRRIPLIAGAHHEKLDGSGYPSRVNAESIPLPSKIMTVADIYDALTAHDRPYKKALGAERALDILGHEVSAKRLDPELVRIFREAEVYRATEGQLAR